MPVAAARMNAKDQAQYVRHLIDQMFGNDIHERPKAKEKLMEMINAADHAVDCATSVGQICNCGIREAVTFKDTEV